MSETPARHPADRTSRIRLRPAQPRQPRVGIVSLGCPKALVDSERIVTRLRAEGYAIAPDYAGADLVLVNTCGFLDSAREESLEAIGEALGENGRVIVTGCLGAEPEAITARHPGVLAVTGPHQYEQVMAAVRAHLPQPDSRFISLVPESGLRLTPRHYAYLKISEGCNNACSFCIIPSLRGGLASRPVDHVLREAEQLLKAGVRELLVISQDTSAYGVDLRYEPRTWRGRPTPSRFVDLCRELGTLALEHDAWVRLHYVYPYPHVDAVIPLMAGGGLLPYLDIPFQHASPAVLKAMRRPAAAERTLERIGRWRAAAPDLAIRSSFVVGFPGETDADFELLLDWLDEARIDRAGCFRYENVAGAGSAALPGQAPEEVKEERWRRFMERQQAIMQARSDALVGRVIDVLVDEADAAGAVGRSSADAPEIDGVVRLPGAAGLSPGARVKARVTGGEGCDLSAKLVEETAAA
jgi:ribosomal protein S12 methylthiotransferase